MVSMVILAALSDAAPILVVAVAVPLAFGASALSLLAIPFATVRKSNSESLGLRKLLDVVEHSTFLAWFDFGILWCLSGIAFIGATTAGPLYVGFFIAAFAVGISAALSDLYLSEEPDSWQEPWQKHPL